MTPDELSAWAGAVVMVGLSVAVCLGLILGSVWGLVEFLRWLKGLGT